MRTFIKAMLILILSCCGFSKMNAQYVTIPDPNFAAWLNTHGFSSCMNGNQLDTTCNALLSADSLYMYNAGISDLTGVAYFDSLRSLTCKADSLNALPILPPLLKYLDVNNNYISTIPFLPDNLETFICSNNDLLSLPNLPNTLTYLHCSGNRISILPVLSDSLRFLSCQGNLLTSLPNLPPKLKYLECQTNQLPALPVLNDSLDYLNCSANLLSAIPLLPNRLIYLNCAMNSLSVLPALPVGLINLNCSQNQIFSLPLLPDSLQNLHCHHNLLTLLPTLPDNLTHLYCSFNLITSIPLLPNGVQTLSCEFNQLVNITNFPDSIKWLDIRNNINLSCLPVLREYNWITFIWNSTGVSCLPNELIMVNATPSVAFFPICDPFNINNCPVNWNIRGSIFSDSISNCILDSVEPLHPMVKVKLYKNGALEQQTYSNQSGLFSFDTDTGNYIVEVDTILNPYTVDCPPLAFYQNQVGLTNLFYDSNNFSLSCGAGFDVGVNSVFIDSGIIRPGNLARINLVAGNLSKLSNLNCATGINGDIKVTINGPATFYSVIPGTVTPTFYLDSLVYSISDWGLVNVFDDFRAVIEIDTAAQLGQQVCISVLINPLVGDVNYYNNYYTHCFTVVNSYDPNDKQVSPSGWTDTSQYDLIYTIRFQNTGNASAQHIYLLDTLDQNIDESSFQLLTYSHEPQMQIVGKSVRFNFPNINLPDSVNNEPDSHGYVQYKVRRNDNLPIGTQIHNTAYIYFDFNPPVQTNTTINTIAVPGTVGMQESLNAMEMTLYPNPLASGEILYLNLKNVSTIQSFISLFEIGGRKVFSQAINTSSKTQQLALPNLAPGIYLAVFDNGTARIQRKLVVVK